MQNTILAIATVLFSLSIKAQSLNDPIYFNYSSLPKTDFDNKNGNASTNFFEVNVTLPALKFGKNVKLFNALYYRNSNFEYGNTFLQNNSFPSNLHDIRYSAIIRVQLNTKWELVALPRIMLRSDLSQSVNGNDFFPQVVVLATYAINPNSALG
jgi:hypothetical protein